MSVWYANELAQVRRVVLAPPARAQIDYTQILERAGTLYRYHSVPAIHSENGQNERLASFKR